MLREQNELSNSVDDSSDGFDRNTQHSFSHVSLHTSCFLWACILKCVIFICSLQLALRAENSVGEMAYYDHYYVQVIFTIFKRCEMKDNKTENFLDFGYAAWRNTVFCSFLFCQSLCQWKRM